MSNELIILITFLFFMSVTGFIAIASYVKTKNVSAFYIADKGAPWYLITGSLMASTVSGASFFGMLAYFYDFGASVFWIPVGVSWSWFIMVFFVGPKLRRFGQFTIPDYLSERFDSPLLRPVFSLLVTIWMVILLGTIYIQGGLLFSTMFDWNYISSIVAIAIIVILFTVFGGMVAVLNTDFFSMFILFIAMVISVPIVVNAAGGWLEVTTTVKSIKPDYFTNTSTVGIFGAISWFLIWCVGYLGHPGYLTRFYTAINVRHIVISGIAISLLYLPFWVFQFVAATASKALYPNIGDPELVWVTYMYEYAPPVIVGIGMAGIFAAVLSSANSWLIAGATSLGRDIYEKTLKRDISDAKLLTYSKIFVLILGALAVPIAIWRPIYIMALMDLAYLIAGSSGGIVILMSLFYRNMTKQAAWVGIIGGAVIAISSKTLQYFGLLTDTLDPIIPTLIITFIAIIIVSRTTKPTKKALELYDRLRDVS